MEHGLVHIYCGDGKGKTTAAVGLAVRCVGSGGKVLFYQFLKDGTSGEIAVLKSLDGINVFDGCKCDRFVFNMTVNEKEKLRESYTADFKELVKMACDYDLLVLDEVVHAVNFDLLPIELLIDFLENKPKTLEVVLTGIKPDRRLTDIADYVSSMVKVKHPFDKGIGARKCIEM
jgi:cob(I)alamin adenosyltransferase